MEAQTPPSQTRPHSQNFAPPSPSPPSSAARLWRPAAQRNLRNQWSKLNSLRHEWRSAASAGRSHATAIVNFYLSQKYMDTMDFGVLSDMPNIRKKASYKLFRQQHFGVIKSKIWDLSNKRIYEKCETRVFDDVFSSRAVGQVMTGSKCFRDVIINMKSLCDIFGHTTLNTKEIVVIKLVDMKMGWCQYQKSDLPGLYLIPELCKGNLLSSYRDMVGVLTQMVQICKSMRCYVRGTSNSPLAQFSLSSDDGSDSGDCGGIPVFTFFSVASFEELALEITRMFISELNLKRLLVVEFQSICHEKDAETIGSQWSNELYKGEFDDLATLNLYSEETQEPNLPSLRNRQSSTSILKSQRQQDSNVLQIYITSWLAEVNIDKCRIDEILGIVGGEMRVDFLETFG